jgi:short-subunit dehydrogenase
MPLALITGATSGIGKEFSKQFAKKGYNLIITGRRAKINQVKVDIENTYNVSVKVIKADFCKEKDLNNLISKIKNKKIDVLVNNAGFGNNLGFFNDKFSNQNAMIKTHIDAVTRLTYEIGKNMIKKKSGSIINVASVAALIPVWNSELYSATKSYILLFTKSIAKELKRHNINIQCLCPAFVNTDFYKRKHTNKARIAPMSPETLITESIRCLGKRKVVCIPGFWNKVAYLFFKIFR